MTFDRRSESRPAAVEPVSSGPSARSPVSAGPDRAAAPAVPETGALDEAGGLVVDDRTPELLPGQMRKSALLALLERESCAAADRAIARTGRDTDGCPLVRRWLAHYGERDARTLERAIRRFAPDARGALSASDYVASVASRVGTGAAAWAETGRLPELPGDMTEMGLGLLAAGDGIAGVAGAIAGTMGGLFRKAAGSGAAAAGRAVDRGALDRQLGPGRPLDSRVRSRLEPALGHTFAHVRIHADAPAARAAEGLDALAFTLGPHVGFAAGAYRPGTPAGDALLAHELAHVAQQRAATPSSAAAPLGVEGAGGASLEDEADEVAAGAVAELWSPTATAPRRRASRAPLGAAGLRLQRCKAAAPKSALDLVKGTSSLDKDLIGTLEKVYGPGLGAALETIFADEATKKKILAGDREALVKGLAAQPRTVPRIGSADDLAALQAASAAVSVAQKAGDNLPEKLAVVGLDTKSREGIATAAKHLEEAGGQKPPTKSIEEARSLASKANAKLKTLFGTGDEMSQLQAQLDRRSAAPLLDEAALKLASAAPQVDIFSVWARLFLAAREAETLTADSDVSALKSEISAITKELATLPTKAGNLPERVKRLAILLRFFLAADGQAKPPSKADRLALAGKAWMAGEDFTEVFGTAGGLDLFLEYGRRLDDQLAVLAEMDAAGKTPAGVVPTQEEVIAWFGELGKTANAATLRGAYESYAGAFYYHRGVSNTEDLLHPGIENIFARPLSVGGLRPLVCTGYARLGAALFEAAGARTLGFIVAVRASDAQIRSGNTLDDAHALARIRVGGQSFFVSNDSTVDTEIEGIGPNAVAWANKDNPIFIGRGATLEEAHAAAVRALAARNP